MQETDQKVKLSDNHRRVLSAILREVEKTCDATEAALDKQSGLFFRVLGDLPLDDQARLRKLVGKLREELRRLDGEFVLDPSLESRQRTISALFHSALVQVEDCKSPRLRGYGELPPEVESKIDAELHRLIALLEIMIAMVEPRRRRGGRVVEG